MIRCGTNAAGRYLPPKLRLFIDEAVSALRAKFGAAAS